jgi:hypothetical protein
MAGDAPPPDPLTTTEAAALLGWLMRDGARLTTCEFAALTGLQYSGADALLCRASRKIPIFHDDESGQWRAISATDGTNPA